MLSKKFCSLQKHVSNMKQKRMRLADIRDVTKQLAAVLCGNRTSIHADINPSNIMMEKRTMMFGSRILPTQVKLTGFSTSSAKAEQGCKAGSVGFMSPEMMLGLPLTAATDVWSLGSVLAFMMLGDPLFSTDSEYEAFQGVHNMMGQPSAELLDKGMYTERFYTNVDHKWISKFDPRSRLNAQFASLDDIKRARKNVSNWCDPEQENCLNLLKEMLQVNPEDRITPEGIQRHPFITGQNLWGKLTQKRFKNLFKKYNKVVPLNEPVKETGKETLKETKGTLKETKGTLKETKGTLKETKGTLKETRPTASTCGEDTLPPVVLVKPASKENTVSLEDSDGASVTVLRSRPDDRGAQPGLLAQAPPLGAPLEERHVTWGGCEAPSATLPGVHLVQPAAEENKVSLEDQDIENLLAFMNSPTKTVSTDVDIDTMLALIKNPTKSENKINVRKLKSQKYTGLSEFEKCKVQKIASHKQLNAVNIEIVKMESEVYSTKSYLEFELQFISENKKRADDASKELQEANGQLQVIEAEDEALKKEILSRKSDIDSLSTQIALNERFKSAVFELAPPEEVSQSEFGDDACFLSWKPEELMSALTAQRLHLVMTIKHNNQLELGLNKLSLQIEQMNITDNTAESEVIHKINQEKARAEKLEEHLKINEEEDILLIHMEEKVYKMFSFWADQQMESLSFVEYTQAMAGKMKKIPKKYFRKMQYCKEKEQELKRQQERREKQKRQAFADIFQKAGRKLVARL